MRGSAGLEDSKRGANEFPKSHPFEIGHRGTAGLGWQTPSQADPQGSAGPRVDWDNKAHSSPQLMCLSWNAGNLDRKRIKNVAHLRMITNGRFHIVLLQESARTLLQALCDNNAMLCSVCPDKEGGNLAVLLGASGVKHIRNLFGQ